MERRRFPRHDVSGLPLKATLILTGESLLKRNSPHSVEISAHPNNLSQSGISLTLDLNAPWETLSSQTEIELCLERDLVNQPLKGKVVHLQKGDHQTLGLEFVAPLNDMTSFLLPHELQPAQT